MPKVTVAALRPGDVILFRSQTLLGRAIRFATRSPGEAPTVVSHVGVMVDSVDIVESLTTTVRRAFQPAKGTWAARRNALTDGERKAIVTKALSYAGRRYGWLKLIAHAVDYLLFRSRYVARRFLFMDNYPICSWVVAYSYQAAGLSFGVPANQADPDDIWDWVEGHPEEWHLMEVGICPDRR